MRGLETQLLEQSTEFADQLKQARDEREKTHTMLVLKINTMKADLEAKSAETIRDLIEKQDRRIEMVREGIRVDVKTEITTTC